VRGAAGQRHDVAGASRGAPTVRVVGSADVEGELPPLHQVDLAGVVAVHHRRASPGPHPDPDGEQGAAGLGAAGQDGDLVQAGPDGVRTGRIDR
jgi:hypothetical protein